MAQCKSIVVQYSGLARFTHQCKFTAKRDGYCGVHHPDSEKKRRSKIEAKYKAQWEERQSIEDAEEQRIQLATMTPMLAQSLRHITNLAGNHISPKYLKVAKALLSKYDKLVK